MTVGRSLAANTWAAPRLLQQQHVARAEGFDGGGGCSGVEWSRVECIADRKSREYCGGTLSSKAGLAGAGTVQHGTAWRSDPWVGASARQAQQQQQQQPSFLLFLSTPPDLKVRSAMGLVPSAIFLRSAGPSAVSLRAGGARTASGVGGGQWVVTEWADGGKKTPAHPASPHSHPHPHPHLCPHL